MRTRLFRNCAKCGAPFWVLATDAVGNGGRYCSRRCTHRGRGNRSLIDEQILAIRASTEPGRVLAERFGVSESLVCLIRKGKRFKEVVA